MNAPCAVALKEWAAICVALASGRQTILLRKGGLVESGDTFAVEHPRFWLYPTYLHQQEQGVTSEYALYRAQAEAERPSAGQVRLTLLAEVVDAWLLTDEAQALALADLHGWTPATISSRFHYRTPGLTLLLLRVQRVSVPPLIDETPEQAGCRSWVPLATALDPGAVTATLTDAEVGSIAAQVARVLG